MWSFGPGTSVTRGNSIALPRAIVFDGSEDDHHRINDPALEIDEQSILVIRNCGPVGYPGSAEVVNVLPPDYLVKRGITTLPCLVDAR